MRRRKEHLGCSEDWKVIGEKKQMTKQNSVPENCHCFSFIISNNCFYLKGHPEFSINPVFFATCAPLFINASVVIVYRYYRSLPKINDLFFIKHPELIWSGLGIAHFPIHMNRTFIIKQDLNYISREIMMILQKDDEKRKYCIYVKFPFLISNI